MKGDCTLGLHFGNFPIVGDDSQMKGDCTKKRDRKRAGRVGDDSQMKGDCTPNEGGCDTPFSRNR